MLNDRMERFIHCLSDWERKRKNTVAHVVSCVKRFFGKYNIDPSLHEAPSKVTQQMVNDWFAELKPQCSEAKFNQNVWALRKFLSWSAVRNLKFPLQRRPYRRIRKTVTYQELTDVIEPRLGELFPSNTLQVKTILYFLFFTSLDKAFLTKIKRSSFDLDNNQFRLVISKKYIRRWEPLVGTLVKVLRQYFDSETEKKNAFNIDRKLVNGIFALLKKHEILGKDRLISKCIFKESLKLYCEKAGFDFALIRSLMDYESSKTSEIYLDSFSDSRGLALEPEKNCIELIWRKCDHRDRQKYCFLMYRQLRRYCGNPNSKLYWKYGGKDIKCEFTSTLELEWVYKRDQVDQMRKPYLKRKNRKGPFSHENCVFIDREITIKELLDRF